MKLRTGFVLLLVCLLCSSTIPKKKYKLKDGVYATYYISDKELHDDFQPAYNVINTDGTGIYWSGFACNLGVETYNWKIEEDMLILDYKVVDWRDTCDEPMEKDNLKRQYWKFVESPKNEIHFQLHKQVFTDREEGGWTDEHYVWKWVGERY